MSVASSCPKPQQLQELINGVLAPQDSQRLTDHLSDCTTCQQTLKTVATGEIPIDELVANLDRTRPPTDSAYWKVIRQAEIEFAGHASDMSDDHHAVNRDVDTHNLARLDPRTDTAELVSEIKRHFPFLKPSESPAYIGRLDRFEIARVIGRGGMGIVLEGFDTHLQRSVAIKVLNPDLQKNEFARQRFCREARAAAAISHEHVVSMHQVAKESESDVAFLVMQLIDGVTLETMLSDGLPLPTQDVARIGMQIAAGLSAAHGRGMVHRDIKPANILIESETNRVKLTDFGLARATDDVKLTKTGMISGTPLYMSPEQAIGGTADESSDLFSLGAVAYEMATGTSPFQASSMFGVMKRITDETPEPPHRLNSSITKPLSNLIMALLAKSPKDRPKSAAAVTTAFANIVTEFGPISPLQVPAISASDSKNQWSRHQSMSRGWAFGAWFAAAFGFVCLMGAFWLWSSSQHRAGDGDHPEKIVEPSVSQFPSVVLPGNPGTVWSVDFSPNGEQVAAAIEDGSVRLWDIASREVRKGFNAHRGIVWMVKYHPTKPIVVTCGDDGFVKLWDGTTFQLLKEWRTSNSVRGVAFTPEGKRIVAGDREGIINVYDIESGETVATHSQPGAIFGIDYSADGKLIATVGSDKVVRVWDAETFDERQTMSGHDGPIYNVVFGSNGPLLATVGWGNNICIWNVETGSLVQKLQGSNGDVWGVAFCSDMSHLVTAAQDGATSVWELASGKIVATLHGHESTVHNVSLDSTKHRIATSGRDGTIRIWDLSSLRK